jgi:hypothetical protein
MPEIRDLPPGFGNIVIMSPAKSAVLSIIPALALPVVGLVSGRVVGDFFIRGDLIGWTGAVFGVLVYALALASSYSHLRHYYRGFEPQGVGASRALALAVEVATFYMSFAYVIIQSPWAFWGSLIGAFVVFWGNFSSMYRGHIEARRSDSLAVTETSPLVSARTGSGKQVDPASRLIVQEYRNADAEATAHSPHHIDRLEEIQAVVEQTQIKQVRQSMRAIRTEIPDLRPETTEHVVENGLSDIDHKILDLAASVPVGPSLVGKEFGIAKSSAGDKLKRLERMGLLVKGKDGYLRGNAHN